MGTKIENMVVTNNDESNTADNKNEYNNDIKKIERNLKKNLDVLGVDYEALDNKIRKYLIKMEDIIITTFNVQTEAKKMMKGNNLNTQNLAKKMGVARQTMYNNKILVEYAELRNKDFSKINVFSINDEKENEIRNLKEELEKFKKRDFKYMDMKEEVQVVLRENERLTNIIAKLEKEMKDLKKIREYN